MRKISSIVFVIVCVVCFTAAKKPAPKGGWVKLFNGKTLDGWKAGNNASTFSVDSGCIVVHGPTSHLYYVGDANNHEFKNFEFKAQVKTMQGANSGIYFHTAYQESGFPDKGYEVQVNNSHGDDIRTGSLYDVVDVKEVYVKDSVWFTEYIKVQGKRVIVKINDVVVVDYTEPEHPLRNKEDHPFRYISNGTFALQGHDPKSIVYFKNLQVKSLDN